MSLRTSMHMRASARPAERRSFSVSFLALLTSVDDGRRACWDHVSSVDERLDACRAHASSLDARALEARRVHTVCRGVVLHLGRHRSGLGRRWRRSRHVYESRRRLDDTDKVRSRAHGGWAA